MRESVNRIRPGALVSRKDGRDSQTMLKYEKEKTKGVRRNRKIKLRVRMRK